MEYPRLSDKTRQLLLYIIKHRPKTSITSLMKLAYLADLISVTEGDKQISTFTYKRYNFGPFNSDIYRYVRAFSREKLIIEESDFAQGEEYIVYSIPDTATLDFDKLDKKEQETVDELLEAVKGYGAKALTEVAYQTKPMKALKATIGGNEGMDKELDLSA